MRYRDNSHFEVTLYGDEWDIVPSNNIPKGIVIEVRDYRLAGPDCEPGTTEIDENGRHFFRFTFEAGE